MWDEANPKLETRNLKFETQNPTTHTIWSLSDTSSPVRINVKAPTCGSYSVLNHESKPNNSVWKEPLLENCWALLRFDSLLIKALLIPIYIHLWYYQIHKSLFISIDTNANDTSPWIKPNRSTTTYSRCAQTPTPSGKSRSSINS